MRAGEVIDHVVGIFHACGGSDDGQLADPDAADEDVIPLAQDRGSDGICRNGAANDLGEVRALGAVEVEPELARGDLVALDLVTDQKVGDRGLVNATPGAVRAFVLFRRAFSIVSWGGRVSEVVKTDALSCGGSGSAFGKGEFSDADGKRR